MDKYEDAKRDFFLWRKTPIEERYPKTQKEFAELHGVSEVTLWNWGKSELGPKNTDDFRDFVYRAALEGKNPKYAELWARLQGLLKEKEKQDDPISPEHYIEVGRQVAELHRTQLKGDGVCPVCRRPMSLSKDICVYPEPEHSSDGEVGTVGLPTETPKSVPSV